jgi:hypothetical protein
MRRLMCYVLFLRWLGIFRQSREGALCVLHSSPQGDVFFEEGGSVHVQTLIRV